MRIDPYGCTQSEPKQSFDLFELNRANEISLIDAYNQDVRQALQRPIETTRLWIVKAKLPSGLAASADELLELGVVVQAFQIRILCRPSQVAISGGERPLERIERFQLFLKDAVRA